MIFFFASLILSEVDGVILCLFVPIFSWLRNFYFLQSPAVELVDVAKLVVHIHGDFSQASQQM